MFAIGHHKSYARDQTRDNSPEQRHSMPHVVQHTICATRKQRLVPTRRMERMWTTRRVASGVDNDSHLHQKEKGTPTRRPSNQQTRMMTRTFFHECPIATRHSRPRARLQSSHSCAWPNLSRVLLPLTFNTILHETAGHQAAPTLLPQIREASLTQRFVRCK